jgi:flagellar hook-length control protein FliK
MHLNTIQNPSPTPKSAPPTALEGLSDTARDEARFATLLRQNQAAAAQARATPPAPRPEAAPRPEHEGQSSQSGGTKNADSAPAESKPDAPTARSASARESDTRAADATQRPRQAQAPDDAEARPPKKGSTRATRDDQPASTANTGADPAAPDANPWLAALQFTGRVPTDPATANGGTSAGASDAAASNADVLSQASSAAGQRASREHAAMLKADAQDAAALVDPRAAADADAKVAGFAATLVEQLEAAKGDAPHSAAVEGAKPGTAVLAMTSTPTGATGANPLAATPTLTLATPVDSPDFAQALGVQLSVLAKDGVQRAELHLNPADMGPVSVHIVMQGTQAHIDFGADLAATRQAIENGLPGLAGAMRDAGFTLAGGGVSQHSSHRDDGNGSNGSARRRVDGRDGGHGDGASAGHVRRHTVRAGGVDLYA